MGGGVGWVGVILGGADEVICSNWEAMLAGFGLKVLLSNINYINYSWDEKYM